MKPILIALALSLGFAGAGSAATVQQSIDQQDTARACAAASAANNNTAYQCIARAYVQGEHQGVWYGQYPPRNWAHPPSNWEQLPR
jgi:hypothetical protein